MISILLGRWLLGVTSVILLLVPFHALLTVWATELGVNYTAVRLWEEALLVVLVAGVGVLLAYNPGPFVGLLNNRTAKWLVALVAGYIVLHVLMGGVALVRGDVNTIALAYAWVVNLRFLVFFLACLVIGSYWADWVGRHWKLLLLAPAAVVVAFGLLQLFVLPHDFLRVFGYSVETVQPYITVDEKIEYTRLQSTLRGPNPLGAYLIVVLTAVAGLFITKKKHYAKWALAILATVLVMFGTYSRSAWIGAAVAVGVLSWGLIVSGRFRKILLIIGAVALIIGAGSVYAFREQSTVQNVLFHTDDTSQSAASSNEERANALTSGISDVVREPLGRGPGTAGPASVHNDGPGRISESYFIQVGQEVGVIGLAVFAAINVIAGLALWRARAESLPALILAGSLVGLTLVNLLSHAWADDTLAYIWWGMAGLVLGGILVERKEQDGKKT